VLGDLTITVESDDGISNADAIGIELDSGVVQWTTVNGAPVGNVITITVALAGAAAIDNRVFTYTNKTQRPVEVIDAVRRDKYDIDTPLRIIGKDEYQRLSDKNSSGSPNLLYYLQTLTNG